MFGKAEVVAALVAAGANMNYPGKVRLRARLLRVRPYRRVGALSLHARAAWMLRMV